MKMFVYSLVILSCALWEARGYPYYPSYGNVDTYSYGDALRGGMALSRYYSPYYPRGGSMAAFMYRQPEQNVPQQSGQYYLPDRRRQVQEEATFNVPPQQNEVFYPQQPEDPTFVKQPEVPFVPTEATELAEPTEKVAELAPTTVKAVAVPELVEPESEALPEEEPVPKSKKLGPRRKQVKGHIDDDDDEKLYPKMPTGAYFPMFFGWGGGRPGASNGQGPTAIANAFSTGRGGVATSHATAYGVPRPEERAEYTKH